MASRRFNIGTGKEEGDKSQQGDRPERREHDYPTPQVVPHTSDTRKTPFLPPSMLPIETPEETQAPEKRWINQTRETIGDQLDK